MGARFSNQIEDYSDDDFYLAEENINSCTDKSKSKGHYDICDEDICLDSTDTVDATLTVSQSAMPISLNLDQVRSIENELDDYEKVALVYLIFDDPKFALDQLTKFLYSFQDKFLFNWAVHEQSAGTNWQEKLVEALCIIQNYQIISTLGFKKDDLITRFLPHHMFTFVHVNKIRKALYFVCEALLQKHVVNLRNFTWKDLKNKGMDFKFIGTPFLEIHFLQWETLGYIKQDDLNNLCRILKQIDQLDICEKLKELIPLSQKSDNLECNMKKVNSSESNRRKSVSVFEGILDPGSSLETLVSLETSHISADNAEFITDANKYYIDPNKPGICLIINQEVFYREVDKEYQKFLPCEDKKLESRVGTEYDKERLETTFRHFGFKVQTENNLSHLEIIQKIEEVIQSVTDESSLFICIMSHGEKGVVYGVNSCRVEVKYLKRLMCIRNRRYLSGKPKILILQSCQGTKCQKIASDDDDFETDGPSSSVQEAVPPIADLFTFWATVPGYGAIRNKKKGSWFIQSLCDKMTELENKHHFVEICTLVIGDVSSKKWCQAQDEVAMVPQMDSTLRKLFYLPPVRS